MRILSDVDGDEVSLVKRAANKRRFLLLKGDSVDAELNDILDVPWGREGSLLDEIRKNDIDETTEKAVIYAVRLLKGVESELSPETIEKLGAELYPNANPALNSGGVPSPGGLTGTSSSQQDDDGYEGDADGADKDGSASGDDLEGSGSGDSVTKDTDVSDGDDDMDDMAKEDFSSDERKRLASEGKALPDGSFPIRNKGDLSNAIQAYGRAGDKGRAKSWIIRRARALGATSQLPEAWSVSKGDDDVIDEERGTVEVQVPIKKEDGTWDFSGVPEESRSFFTEIIEKADKTASELAEAREQLAKSEDSLLMRKMVEKAARLSHVAPTDELAPVLKEAFQKLDGETFEKMETILKTAEERIEKGDLFTEYGAASRGQNEQKNDAYGELVRKANEMVEKSGDLTFEAAFDRALMENPALYDRYTAERGWVS